MYIPNENSVSIGPTLVLGNDGAIHIKKNISMSKL